jgi:hypothetical protein
MLELLEHRLLLSTAPAVLSVNREIPAGAVTEAASVTYCVAFSEPVTGVTSADFQLAFTGGTSASSAVVVSPGSGYNSVYNVTVNGIAGTGTLGLNLVDNGSILDSSGDHLANANGSFQAQQTFATGSFPGSAAVADVNGDGKADLVVANFNSNKIGVLLGNGDGTFQAQTTFIDPKAGCVVVGDVNGDGKPDLIFGDGSGSVGVALGNGDGTFQATKTFGAGAAPYSIAVTDVNGDGKPDLVVVNEGSTGLGSASILLGNGDGSFQTQRTFSTGKSPSSVAVADVNGDGKPDLIVSNAADNTVSLLLGNGDGTFGAQSTFAAGSSPSWVAVSDVNGDAKPDLVITDAISNDVSVLLGNGNGTFQALNAFYAGISPDSVAIADMNGDGKADLVVANMNGNNVTVLLGNGNGTFQAQKTFATGNYPISVVAADVNGDGKPDIVVPNLDDGTLSVLLNNMDFTGQLYTIDQPARLAFTQPPASTPAGNVINGSTGVQVAVEDSGGATVGIDTSAVTLTLNGGAFASGGNTVTTAAVNGVATFNNLIINAAGNYTMTASDGALAGATSSSFAICTAPAVLSVNRESPAGAVTEAASVTYAVTFSEPVTGVTAADFQLALGGGTSASSAVVVSPGSGYNSVYNVTVNSIVGSGTLGLNLVDNGSILDQAGNHLSSPIATFQAQQIIAAGQAPAYVAMADLNGDGKPDLVVADNGGSNISVQLGNGDGTFQAPKTYAVGSYPSFVAVADVNGDGKPDLVVANQSSNTVSVLLGNGDGTFQAQKTFAVGSYPSFVAVGDVNGDGKPDLAVANAGDSSNVVSVLLGNGDGTFQAQKTFTAGVQPYSVALADLNGDNKLDLVTTNYSNNVSVLLGNGDGTFQAQQTFAVDTHPSSVVVADVNGDGKPDLVVANQTTNPNTSVNNALSILLGNGDGTFQPQKTFTVDAFSTSVAVADMNGDGTQDLVVTNTSGKDVSVLLGNGDGTFQAQNTFATGTNPSSVAVADVNGDGRPDLVVANETSNTVSLLLGNNNSFAGQVYTIDDPTQLAFRQQPASSSPGAPVDPLTGVQVAVEDALGNAVAADTSTVTLTLNGGTFASGGNTVTATAVNGLATFYNLIINTTGSYTLTAGDGSLAGATSSTFANVPPPQILSINRENPAGAMSEPPSVTYAVTFNEPVTGVTSADFQLAFTGGTSAASTVAVWPSSGYNSVYNVTVNGISGNGTLGLNLVDNGSIVDSYGGRLTNFNGTFQAQRTLAMVGPEYLAVADLNGDNKLDMVAVSSGVGVRMGNGDGTFQPQQTYTLGSYLTAKSVVVADLNGDGRPDLIVTYSNSWMLSVLLNNGDGTFQSPINIATISSVSSVAVADVNGDGKMDLLVANESTNNVSVMLGYGNGAFQAPMTFAAGAYPTSIAVADLNGDGKQDLVVTNDTGAVSTLLGNGDGTFQSHQTFATGAYPESVDVADLNGDGKPDLIVGNVSSNNVGVLLGNGDGTFQAQKTFATGTNPDSVAVTDVNGDGKLDLVVANNGSGNIGVLMGNGDGTFQTQKTFAAGSNPICVAAADLNGDGTPDLVVANNGSNTIGVLLGNNSFAGQFYTIDQPTKLAFSQPPAGTLPGSVLNGATGVLVAVEDTTGATVGIDSSVVTLSLNGGAFASGGNTVSVAAVNGVATFKNLIINAAGNYTMSASDGALAGATSSSFTIDVLPNILSVSRGTPAGTMGEPPSVTYVVTFNEPVAGVTSADFQLAFTGGTSASSTVAVSPSGGYNSVYAVTVNGISGKGTLGLNLVDNGSIVDGYGSHLANTGATFQAQQTFATGSAPDSVAVADVNGDGKPDLIVANSSSNNVGVLLGNGNGTFQPQQTFAVGSDPTSVAVADLNGDGRLDLVVTNYNSNTVSVLLGNGDGTFLAQKTFATCTDPQSVVVADLNGDGKPDLVVGSDYYMGSVNVLMGNGDGTFQADKSFSAGEYPESVAVADVNGDGKKDLVVAAFGDGDVNVLLGNGDGTFQSAKTFTSGWISDPYSVAVADVNGDGKPDVVLASGFNGYVGVLLGNGDGTFQNPSDLQAGTAQEFITVADVNGDGKPDLVTSNYANGTLSVLLGNGDGTFQTEKAFAAGSSPWSVEVADLNGDGRPDLVTANESSNNVSVLLANSSFTGQVYTIDQPTKLVFAQPPTGTTAGSAIDGSTGVQVAVEDSTGATVTADSSTVTLTLSGGTFASGGNTVTVVAASGVATFNNLIIDAAGSYTLTASDGTLTGATSGSFSISAAAAAKLTFTQQPPNGTAGVALSSAIAVAIQDPFGNTVTTNNSTVTLTLSSGAFASGGTTVTASAVNGVATFGNLIIDAAGSYTLAAGDGALTGAASGSFTIIAAAAAKLGFTQQPANAMPGAVISPAVIVAVQDSFGNTVATNSSTVKLTLSSGTFASGGSTVTVSAVNGIATFNNLIVNASGNYTLAAGDGSLIGAASSSFTIATPTVLSIDRETPTGAAAEAASVTYAVTFNEPVTGVTAANFQLTLTGGASASSTVVVSPAGGYNSVYNVTVNNIRGKGTLGLNLVGNGSILDQAGNHLANASATFQAQQTFATGTDPVSVALADVNGDGKLDLVMANASDNTVSVLLSNGDGTFQAQQTFATGTDPDSVAVADVNGDGKADLVVTNSADNTVSVLLGNGDGTFQAQKSFAVGTSPSFVAVSDVNGDGKSDLIVTNLSNRTVGVLLGNGDGTFQAQKTFTVGTSPSCVAVSDVNGDGKPDLVVTNDRTSGTVSVLLGNGDGTFQAQKTFAVGADPSSVVAADVNGDGKPDLAVVNSFSGTVSVLLGNGDGTFQAQKIFATRSALESVAVADINGDGQPDLVTADSDSVGVLLGNGDGTFQTQQTFATGADPQSVAVADVNGDGKLDLVVANSSDNTVSVLLSNNNFMGQLYTVDQPTQLAFTQAPSCTTAGKVINSSTGVQVAVEDSGGTTVGADSSIVTLTLSGGTFADGGTTEAVAAVNGIAAFNHLMINATGNYTLTAGDGTLTGATSGSFLVCPLGDVVHVGFINSTNGAADIDAVYAHLGDTTGRYDLNGDGLVNQADVDYLVRNILQTNYGDVNLDSCVDYLDYQVTLNHWQVTGAGWASGDFNGDGVTDFLDFKMLLNDWNPGGSWATVQSDSTSVSSAGGTVAVETRIAKPAAPPPSSAPAVLAQSASASTSADDPINLLSREFTPAAGVLPAAVRWVKMARPSAAVPTEADTFSSDRTAVRPLPYSAISFQDADAGTVDLLTHLHSGSVVG